jgi:hypothetical protein
MFATFHCIAKCGIHDTSYPSGGHCFVGPAKASDLNRRRKTSRILGAAAGLAALSARSWKPAWMGLRIAVFEAGLYIVASALLDLDSGAVQDGRNSAT